ncbi:odv-e25 [Clostera anachoreta granulovirus]|uniref:Odv-e25 n=1 Tax=Clostera anachoreta granulovirus TaxID=283675 RepID=F4ZKV3_9BBAC|nr:odv-e25 [Clostera anachoreta granulovirus]AEB00364.1 odv-e25 [Clostera anachoreta granulovirus]
MLGTIVMLLVIGVILYLLWINDKINVNSLNESSGQSGDSIQFTPDGASTVRVNGAKVKNVRIAHDDNFSKVSVIESPVGYEQIVDFGDDAGHNTVILGTLDSVTNGATVPERITSNLTIRRFKNMFVIFKGVNYRLRESNNLMEIYEANNMIYALVDASNSTIPEYLKMVTTPICVLINNSSAQLVLKEWNFTQVNNSATLFVKNEKSFRLH